MFKFPTLGFRSFYADSAFKRVAVRNKMANIIAEAFALYNNTNNIPVGYVIRDILFKNGNPLGCGSASNLSLRQSGFWHRSAPEPGEGGDEHYLGKSLADGIFQAPRYKSALEWTGQRHLYRRLLAKETTALEFWEADFFVNTS